VTPDLRSIQKRLQPFLSGRGGPLVGLEKEMPELLRYCRELQTTLRETRPSVPPELLARIDVLLPPVAEQEPPE
jgi:hypothetical protein